ncbi:MAG: YdcF family protein [Chloroflexota bacterium]
MTILTELLVRALCDEMPSTEIDAAYLFSQTRDNQQSALDTGVKLFEENKTQKILITDSEPRSGYLGFSVWFQQLVQMGVPEENLQGVPTHDFPVLHTLAEATAVVRYAKAQALKTLLVVSPPFHMLRAFMTTVSVALRDYPSLKIFSQPGRTLPWKEVVVHSQGTLNLVRHDLIHSEIERIATYQAKGDLAATQDVLAYLNQRT